MGLVLVNTAMSLDGMIAGPNAEMDWIFEHPVTEDSPDDPTEELVQSTGLGLGGGRNCYYVGRRAERPETGGLFGAASSNRYCGSSRTTWRHFAISGLCWCGRAWSRKRLGISRRRCGSSRILRKQRMVGEWRSPNRGNCRKQSSTSNTRHGSSRITLRPTTTLGSPWSKRAGSRKPSAITSRPCGSIRITPTPARRSPPPSRRPVSQAKGRTRQGFLPARRNQVRRSTPD